MNSRMPNSQTPEINVPQVSVIVPVYNTELYVERAIISLMEQTLEDVQFIIIDDGSKDNSLNIIKSVIARYPTRDGQVTLISRENRGVGATRAEGINLAAGKYIIHLDSDDWAESNWLEVLYSKAVKDNADVVICNYKTIFKRNSLKVKQSVSNSGMACAKLLLLGKVSNMNWDKLVRRELLFLNDINFFCGLDMGEDFYVTLKVFCFSSKVSHVDECLYNYNKTNELSLTKVYSSKSLSDIVAITNLAETFITKNNFVRFLAKEFDFFKIGVRNCFVANGDKSVVTKKGGVELYPETNYLIEGGYAPKALTLAYYLNEYNILYLHTIYDLLVFFRNLIFKKF